MNIFKAYDIRGKEISKETAYNLGISFVIFLNKKHPKIVVGRDGRLSSPELFKYFKKGVKDFGGKIIDIGISTTPMLYFSSCFLKTDGGVMITASHNPKEYNGFKLVGKMASPIGEESGLKEIEKIYKQVQETEFSIKKGEQVKKSILKDYLEYLQEGFDLKSFGFKIASDTGNSVSILPFEKIVKKTNLKVSFLNKEIDGNFPNHNPDPLLKANLKELIGLIKNKKLDLGIAFDGDADRVTFINEKGLVVPSDIILSIVADVVGGKTLCDIRCSNIVNEITDTVQSRVGHSFIKEIMKKEKVFIGAEYSGHLYLNKNKYCFENPYFFLFTILEQMNLTGKTLSELAKPYQKYYHSGEINFKVDNPKEIIKKIDNLFQGKKTKIDGLRIDFDEYWFLIRPSNTEPLLRLIIEATSKKLLDEKKRELKEIIYD